MGESEDQRRGRFTLKLSFFHFLTWLSFWKTGLRELSKIERLLWRVWVWCSWLVDCCLIGREIAEMKRQVWFDCLTRIPKSFKIRVDVLTASGYSLNGD